MTNARLKTVLRAIAAITMVSGAAQLILPGFVLDLLAAESTASTRHFFAIVGMFMFLFGGMLLHGLRVSNRPDVILLWASLQKFGAAAAVGIGVGRGVFSALALLVAGFDLLSGLLIFWYREKSARQ
jgi:hypothetical protein